MTLTKKLTILTLGLGTVVMFQNCSKSNFIKVENGSEISASEDTLIQLPSEVDPPINTPPVVQTPVTPTPTVQTPVTPTPTVQTPVTPTPTVQTPDAPTPIPAPIPTVQSKLGDCGTTFSTTIDGGQGADSYFGLLVAGKSTIPTLIVRPGDGKDTADITIPQGSEGYKNFALQFSNLDQLYVGVYRADTAQIEEGFKCSRFITTTTSVAAGKTYTYNGCTLDTDLISARLAPGQSMMFRAGVFSKSDVDNGSAIVRNFSGCVRVTRALN